MPVTLLIVGAGSRGSAFADYARRHPDEAEVVAVAEPREAYRSRHAVEHRFADWREALARPKLADAVVIATPDRDHTEPAIACADAGYALLIEKPLATSEEDCARIVEAVERAGVVAAVAHVLRYTAYTRLVKRVLDSGAIGEIVSIEHLEPVGFWHQAHSYVRGNWRREADAAPMLLAKCCHDLDWLSYLVGRRCVAVSSFGGLMHFRREERPAGAGDRCVACDIEPACAYSAKRLYLERGVTDWPVDVVAWPPTRENIARALRDGPYGRCVWACDNDVVDHQVVSLQYENGATATLTMTGFTRMRDRETRIFGTRGELRGDGNMVEVYDFLTESTTRHHSGIHSDGEIPTGHGGGDDGVMADFLAAVAAGDPAMIPTTPRETLESHRIAFAAEQARRERRVVTLAYGPGE
ncbi:Gfo/Idh/MocA family protein [Solirubrobacter soli]|uniref:Gfo/Idh/MocA family protein n=1 Tax=Solirubrobacter soli TaxID=363832 RepID=UPI0004060DB1|nr:Gfo/Idh/MocA family oxidoreductase [Solirubrobacter soli]